MIELWKPVDGYEGRYEISNLGRVKSLPNSRRKTELILKQTVNPPYGHRYVRLTNTENGRWKQRAFAVHRLVALAFIENPNDLPFVCHKDGDTSDNSEGNLYWGTPQSNMDDRELHGTVNRGRRNGRVKLTEETVRLIRSRFDGGEQVRDIAEHLSLPRTTVSSVAHRQNWKHVA